MSSDQYTPSEAQLRIAWADHSQGMDPRAEFDRFLAGVKRDAAREALEGYAAAEEDRFLSLHVKDAPIAAAQCTHAAITARDYRYTHYPITEETP